MNEISAWPIGHQGETIVIVTSDNDFVETSSVLRSYGVEVIGIGTRHQSKPNWISSCSTFYFIDDIKYDAVRDTEPASVEAESCGTEDDDDEESAGTMMDESVSSESSEPEEQTGMAIGVRGATCRKEFYFSFDDVEGFDGCNPPVLPGDTVEFTIARNFNPSLADARARTGQAKLVRVV